MQQVMIHCCKRHAVFLLYGVTVLFCAFPAQAQNIAPALEEIIVTAERKASPLQETPISLAAFGSRQMEVEGINNLRDIATKVPNLTIQPFPTDSATLRIYIRGIGLVDSQISQDPSIAVYIDGIYIARSVGTALDVADLERLEVLRGPQGTLYGRNATGGAVNLITRRPNTEELEFSQKFSAGNRNLFSSRTSLNLPLSSTFAAKLSYLQSTIDGFVDNGGPGGDWGDKDTVGWRIGLLWQPAENISLYYSHDASDIEYYNYTYQAVTPGRFRDSTVDLVQQNANNHVRNGPGYTDRRLDRLDSFAPLEESRNEINGDALIVSWEIANAFNVEYLYGRRDLFNSVYVDLGSGAADETYRLDSNVYVAPDGRRFPFVPLTTRQDQSSHEFKFSGDFLDERLEYTAGVYYFEEEARLVALPLFHQFHSTLDEDDAPLLGPNLVIISAESRRQHVDNSAWAAYSRWTWTPLWLDQRLHLTLGGRYSRDKRQADKTEAGESLACPQSGGPCATLATSGYSADASDNYSDASFTAIANFDVHEELNVYVKFDEAYRAGGFNVRDPHKDANDAGNNFGFGFVDGFDSEKVQVYELGLRSQFFQNRVRLNATLFQQDFIDQQINFLFGGNIADTKATNVGESDLRGGEMDLAWQASAALRLKLNYAYLDARIEKAIDPVTGQNVADEFVFFSAPRHSLNTAADWQLWQGDWGHLDLHLSYSYMTERNGTAQSRGVNDTELRSFGLWNARLYASEIPLGGGQLQLALWGKNLLDEEYAVDAINNLPQAERAVVWGEPRTYGLDISWRY